MKLVQRSDSSMSIVNFVVVTAYGLFKLKSRVWLPQDQKVTAESWEKFTRTFSKQIRHKQVRH